MLNFILFTGAVGFGIARFIVPVEGKISHEDIFKDLAHIFVGILFGVAICSTWGRLPPKVEDEEQHVVMKTDAMKEAVDEAMIKLTVAGRWGLAILLTVTEIVAFFVRQQP